MMGLDESKPLRWGILGCARISRRGLIPGIHDSRTGTLLTLASRDGTTAREWAQEFGVPKAAGSYEEVLADPEIDAVLDKERNAPSIDERRKIIQEETLPTIARKAPALALFTSVFIHAYTKGLEGLYIYPNGMQDVTKATLA